MDDKDDHSRDASHYYRNDQFHADLDKLTPAQRRAFIDGDTPDPIEDRRNPADLIVMDDCGLDNVIYLRLGSFKHRVGEDTATITWMSEAELSLN